MSTAGTSATLPSRARPARAAACIALASASLAWLFDAMDLQLFTLVLFPSISSLIHSTNPGRVAATGGLIAAGKFFAWGLGGIAFGVVADRTGRARTMVATVIIYATFTGLSGLAQTWWQLAALQALAGIGMGGEWAAGAALVAETWPERSRVRAMQMMQLCFGLGFFAAAALNLIIGPYGWRWVFAAGAAPGP
ncbi:MAG: MFS transporter, partial [Acetobacteraceae bacterium]|nr:MFS transporter [Acetobacteraceae bacterium]